VFSDLVGLAENFITILLREDWEFASLIPETGALWHPQFT
jgi:hypothetical protein